MNLDSMVKQGRLPWRPNALARELDVWHQYETPLTGTFSVGDSVILFTLVMETDSDVSVWAYMELPHDVAQSVGDLSFEGVHDLNQWVEEQFRGHEAVLAFAKEGRLAGRWGRKHVDRDLLTALESFLQDLIHSVDEVEDTSTRIRAKVAGVAAARRELPNRSTLVEA